MDRLVSVSTQSSPLSLVGISRATVLWLVGYWCDGNAITYVIKTCCSVFLWIPNLDCSTFISSSQNLSFPHSIHLFRQNFQWLLQQHSTTSQTSGEVDGESLSLKRIWTISWILWAVLLLKILFKGQEIKITSLPRQFIENWDNFSSCWKRQFLLGSFLTYFSILYKMIIKIQTANCNF